MTTAAGGASRNQTAPATRIAGTAAISSACGAWPGEVLAQRGLQPGERGERHPGDEQHGAVLAAADQAPDEQHQADQDGELDERERVPRRPRPLGSGSRAAGPRAVAASRGAAGAGAGLGTAALAAPLPTAAALRAAARELDVPPAGEHPDQARAAGAPASAGSRARRARRSSTRSQRCCGGVARASRRAARRRAGAPARRSGPRARRGPPRARRARAAAGRPRPRRSGRGRRGSRRGKAAASARGELALQPGDLLAQVAAGGGLVGDGRRPRARRRRRCGRRAWRTSASTEMMLRPPTDAAGPYWARAPQRPDGHGRPVHRPAPRHGARPLPHAAGARRRPPPPRRRGARRGVLALETLLVLSAVGPAARSAGSGSARRSTTGRTASSSASPSPSSASSAR